MTDWKADGLGPRQNVEDVIDTSILLALPPRPGAQGVWV